MDALNAIYDREGCIETEEATALVDDERLTGQRDW